MDAFTDIGWFLYISLDSYKVWMHLLTFTTNVYWLQHFGMTIPALDRHGPQIWCFVACWIQGVKEGDPLIIKHVS